MQRNSNGAFNSEAACFLPVVLKPRRAGLPELSSVLLHILREVQQELGYRLHENSDSPALEYLETLVSQTAQRLGLELTGYERDLIIQCLEHDQSPFGVLQPLVEDRTVSDIIVSSPDSIVVQQGRKNYATDLRFADQIAYEAFVEKLLSRCKTTYSTKKPIADGMYGSLARVHVVHNSITESGPYLTIRLNRFSAVRLNDLLKNGLAPAAVLQYLSAVVHLGSTVLVVGEVGTGKTTLLRALAATLAREEALLVIEDTPEIKLEHPHVRYVRTREANSDGAGRITPGECIRGGMRMAMNRIIFGEMRDAEAAESFIDVCASGHPGLSTIHGKSALDALVRLELFLGRAQKGVAQAVLQQQIATAVQVVVHVDICQQTGLRRIKEVIEIGGVADGRLRHKSMFVYSPVDGRPCWRVNNRLSNMRSKLEETGTDLKLSALPALLELDIKEDLKI